MKQNNQQHHALTPWLIWSLVAFFFFAHYVVRVTPGQITEELQLAFANSSKYDIGILGAAFYLPYVVMQMPVGVLVDKYGPRLLLTIAVFICSISSLIFAEAASFNATIFSRALLGFCSATAFIGALKLITVWFPPHRLALMVGVTQALGMIGASFGAGAISHVLDQIGWQHTFHIYALTFFGLAILIFLLIKNQPSSTPVVNTQSSQQLSTSTFKVVLLNKYTWINALYAGLLYAPTDVMAELWGKEFLTHIHQIEGKQAAFSISLLFIGWAIGSPIAGHLANKFGRKPIMVVSALAGLCLFPILFYVQDLSNQTILILMFLYGLTNTGIIAAYTIAGELHPKSCAGLSLAIANMMSVLLGAILMPLLGWLLGRLADKALTTSGTVGLTAQDYKTATIILPLCTLFALLAALFVKETLPRKTN